MKMMVSKVSLVRVNFSDVSRLSESSKFYIINHFRIPIYNVLCTFAYTVVNDTHTHVWRQIDMTIHAYIYMLYIYAKKSEEKTQSL